MTDSVRLRGSYNRLLAVSIAAVVFAAGLLSSTSDGDRTTLIVARVVVGVASVCLLLSVGRGLAAVRGDRLEAAGLRGTVVPARVASLVGWLGAIAVAATGFVDDALLRGIVLAAAALILGVCGDAAHRVAKHVSPGR